MGNKIKIFLLIMVQILFGLNFIAAKYAVTFLDVWFLVAARFLIVAFAMAIILPLFWRQRPSFTTRFLAKAFILSALGYTLTQGLMLKGLEFTAASNVALITTLVPILTLALAITMGKAKFSFLKLIGFLLSFCGIIYIQDFSHMSLGNSHLIGTLLALAGVLCLSVFLVFSKEFLRAQHGLWNNSILFSFAALQTLPLLAYSHGANEIAWHPKLSMAFIYVLIGGTLLAYLLTNYLLKRMEPELVSLYAYLQPIIAAAGAYLFLGTPPKEGIIVSTFFLLFGFVLASDGIRESLRRKLHAYFYRGSSSS